MYLFIIHLFKTYFLRSRCGVQGMDRVRSKEYKGKWSIMKILVDK